jgi:trigger factor
VTDDAVDRTIDILRKQRQTFSQRAHAEAAIAGDRVTITFEGKIDGEPFDGGRAEDFQFTLGDGRMLTEFDQAVTGMKTGESKTFPLTFPADYQGKEVAGKEADFLVTLTKVEQPHLPEIDEAFVASLAIQDATVEGLRADVRKNLEREVKFRLAARNREAVLNALDTLATFDVPKALIDAESERLVAGAREDLKSRGIKDADKMPVPAEMFASQAERRVRLGLALNEMVRAHGLKVTPEQLTAHIDDLAQSYENPAEVVRWYFSDRQRLAEIESAVLENNVTEFVLGKAVVTDKALTFDELMAMN